MQLPLSSSPASVAGSDGALSTQLMLADVNAEYNRLALSHCDDFSDGASISSASIYEETERLIHFHPQVSVRYIRPRSNTCWSAFSDRSGSFRVPESPLGPDTVQLLREASPLSEDEEFDRFYRTMESASLRPPAMHIRLRKLSLDETRDRDAEDSDSVFANRRRSASCDQMFFQSMGFKPSVH